MKILYPQGEASAEEIEEMLKIAIEGRKRVKDQLMRIDTTYADVRFAYEDRSGNARTVRSLEEEEYPHYYHKTVSEGDLAHAEDTAANQRATAENASAATSPEEKHVSYQENQRGVSYDMLFGPYLKVQTV